MGCAEFGRSDLTDLGHINSEPKWYARSLGVKREAWVAKSRALHENLGVPVTTWLFCLIYLSEYFLQAIYGL